MEENFGITPLKSVAKGAAIFFVGMMLSKVLAFFYRVFVARYFGPADYGTFALGLAVLGFFEVVAVFGIESAVSRFVPFYAAKNDQGRVRGTLTSGIKIVLAISITLVLVMSASSFYIADNFFGKGELAMIFLVLSLSLPFSALNTVLLHAFLGFQRIKYKSYSYIFSNTAKLVTVAMFGLLGFGVMGMVWSWVISLALTFMLDFYSLQRKVYPIFGSAIKSVSINREMLSFSLPLVFGSLASVIISWADTIILGIYRTTADVGVYNAVNPIVQLLTLIPFSFTVVMGPVLTGLYSGGRGEEMKNVYKSVTKWMFYANFPFFLILLAFPRQVIGLVFGEQYIYGYPIMAVLGFGYITYSIALGGVSVLATMKKTKYITALNVLSGIANLALNLYLIPPYGMMGAAFSAFLSIALGNTLTVLCARRFIGVSPLSRHLLKPVAAGSISVAVVFYAIRFLFGSANAYVMILSFCVFLGLYGVLMLLFRAFDESDREILLVLERKTGLNLGFFKRFV